MNDLVLRAHIGATNMFGTAVSRMRSLARNERGSVVETVVIIAIMVLAAVFIFGAIFTALKSQGSKITSCITGVNASGTCTDFK